MVGAAVLVLGVLVFLVRLANSSVMHYLASYGVALGIGGIGYYFVFRSVATISVRLFMSRLVERLGLCAVLAVSMVFVLISYLLTALSTSLVSFLAAGVLAGVGLGTIIPLMSTHVLLIAPQRRKGTANSVFMVFGDLGEGSGGALWGAVTQTLGYSAAYLSAAGIMAAALLVLALCLWPVIKRLRATYDNLEDDMAWWNQNSIRMIQNNLREVDAGMDPQRYAQTLEALGANVAMIGCGGISALYPTQLEYQRVSPFLKGDFVGDVVEACHKRGIRVILRFDFTKTDARFIETHPEWFVRNDAGECMTYSGTAAACVNGAYYQRHMFEILGEALGRYPADGIFFNAFMFGSFDYDGNFCRICRCESCQKRFLEYAGLALPAAEDPTDPVYRTYQAFQAHCLSDLLDRVRALVRDISPNIAVSTYNNNVDIIRNESNCAVDRPPPFWVYASSDNAATVTDTFEGGEKISCNVAINFVDFFSRFMGVSPQLTKLRLLESMACGAGLDWCIIGSFEDYPDRKTYEVVREVFHHHKRYEAYYSALKPDARILLVRSQKNSITGHDREYRGIFKMLKESHRIFRIVEQDELDRFAGQLDEFDTILLPGVELDADRPFTHALKQAKAQVIATGLALQENPELLEDLFGVRLGEPLNKPRGHYLLTEPKSVFGRLADTDWVYLDMEYRPMALAAGNTGWMPLVLPAPFGPPEFCYGHKVSTQPSVSVKDGRLVYLPFMLGTLYYQHGFTEFRSILLDVMDACGEVDAPFETDAPPCVEMFWHRCGENRWMLQLLNLSGCNGITVEKPLPVHGITVRLNGKTPKQITELAPAGERVARWHDKTLSVPVLETYAAFLIEAV